MVDPKPDYESIDWSTIEQRFRVGALRAKLMRLALSITAMAIVLLIINLVGLFWLRANITDLVENRAPLVDATRRAQTGLQRALAGLRGWVAMEDPKFRQARLAAWSQDIEPALERIDVLASRSPDFARLGETVAGITTQLDKLRESQWWVDDVAQTPGNEPALVFHDHFVAPVRRDIEASLYEVGELAAEGEGTGDGIGNGPLANLSLFQMRLGAADAALREFIETGATASRWTFEQNIGAGQALLSALDAGHDAWRSLPAAHIRAVAREFPWYVHHAREAAELRAAPEWNVAQYFMALETVPLTRALTARLDALAQRQSELMQSESDHVALAGNATVVVSLALIGLMGIMAYALTSRRAEQITRPVHRLAQATSLLARGELNENLPVTTNDELGRLTVAFNHMRVNLQRSEAGLRRANDRMAADLQGAASYVRSALPPRLDADQGWVVTDWTFIASAELGGDFFGYHWIDDDHFAIYLLDVCGHGVGPAMLSMSAHNALRQKTLPDTDFRRPGEVLKALNRAFPMAKNQNKFFTIWYGVYDTRTRRLSSLCSAI